MTTANHPAADSFALLDGALCQVTWRGEVVARHAPIATAIVEFLKSGEHIYVREHPYGFLTGVANLYALDADLRTVWLAELPESDDHFVAIQGETSNALVAVAASGRACRLDKTSGELLGIDAVSGLALAQS